MYLLAKHPVLQKRLREEVRANLPSPSKAGSESITAAVVDAMPLLNAVCNEATRLYRTSARGRLVCTGIAANLQAATVPSSSRVTVKPIVLGGHVLPTGTNVYLVPWAINRSTKFWGNEAMEFKPERWINADGKPNNTDGATSNFSIMTFLHSPRSCIGQGFARSELKCLLAATIGRHECALTRSDETYVPAELVTTKAANGMWLKLKEIEGW